MDFTDADAFMTAHLDDNGDAYASAVEAKIAEFESWNAGLVEIILNHECPITSCLLKIVKSDCNALEWAARNDDDALENILSLMSFGIQNAAPQCANAFASVQKDLFTEPLIASIEEKEDTVTGAISIMVSRNLTLEAIAAAPTVDVENMDRGQLTASSMLDIMTAFVQQHASR